MPDRDRERTETRDDATTALPFRVQVMSAAGRLPLWRQNSCNGSPSSTVVELGSTKNEVRMTKWIRGK